MDQKRLQDLIERIAKYPTNILDRFVLAKMYHDHQLWNNSVEECQKIIKLKPDYLIVQMMLGEGLLRMEQYSLARDTLHVAKELATRQNHVSLIPEIEDLLDEIPNYS